MIEYDNLRRMYDIKSMVGMGRKNWCVCPLPDHIHHNYTPSFSVYWYQGVQYFKCHGNCGAYGDAIDLIGYMEIPGYNKVGDNRREAAARINGTKIVSPPKPPPNRAPMANYLWREYLPISPEAYQYALARGISTEQIEEFRLGSSENWLAIPTFHHMNLMGIKLRNMRKGLRYMSVTGSKQGLWGYNDVVNTEETVFVCKGEIAAIIMRRFGFLSCAPTSGESAKVDRDPLALASVIVVGDNDAPEIAKQTRRQAEERAESLKAKLFFPPSEYKDVDEWLLLDTTAPEQLRSIS